jgi:hypothetical protein
MAFGRGCGPYIKAYLAAQTPIHVESRGRAATRYFAEASF